MTDTNSRPASAGDAADPGQADPHDLRGAPGATHPALPPEPSDDDSPPSTTISAGRASPRYPLATGELRKIRQQRVAEYEIAAVDKEDDFEALLAASTADLFGIANSLAAETREALTGGLALDEQPELKTALDMLLRVYRQIDRYGQLQVRAAEARTQAELAKTTLATMTIHSPGWDPAAPLFAAKPSAN